MGAQGLETLPPGVTAEHESMLGFAGRKYAVENNPDTKMKRFVFVGFEAVELIDLRVANGEIYRQIWFSRGYFNPNIARVKVDRLTAGARFNREARHR